MSNMIKLLLARSTTITSSVCDLKAIPDRLKLEGILLLSGLMNRNGTIVRD